MSRRSILSALCTGALALLAPVVAWAKPHRKVRSLNRGVKGIILGRGTDHIQDNWVWDSFDPRNRISTPLPDGVVAITETHLMATYQRERTLTTHNAELRALLAEAREMLALDLYEVRGSLINRIDDALKGDKRNA